MSNERVAPSAEKRIWWKAYKHDPGVYPTFYGDFVRENRIDYKDIARLTGIAKNMVYWFGRNPEDYKMSLMGASRILAALREIVRDNNLTSADIFRKSHPRNGFTYEDIDRKSLEVDLSIPPVPIEPLPRDLKDSTHVGRLYRMKDYMDHNGATVEDLIEVTGLRRQHITEMMNLEYGAKWYSASIIAEALGTTVDNLRGYDGEESYETVEPTPYASDEDSDEPDALQDDTGDTVYDSMMRVILERFNGINSRFDLLNERIDQINERFDIIESRFGDVEDKVFADTEVHQDFVNRLASIEQKLGNLSAPKKRFWQS